MPDLAELACSLHRFDHVSGTFNRVGHHFFTVNMTARFKSHNCMRSMPEVRGSDEDRIERFFFEHFFNIDIPRDIVAETCPDGAEGSTKAVRHNVDCRCIVNARNVDHGIEQDFLLFAATNEANTDFIRPVTLLASFKNGGTAQS